MLEGGGSFADLGEEEMAGTHRSIVPTTRPLRATAKPLFAVSRCLHELTCAHRDGLSGRSTERASEQGPD